MHIWTRSADRRENHKTGGISRRVSVAGGNRKRGIHPCSNMCLWVTGVLPFPLLYSALRCESLPFNLCIALLIDILMSSSVVRIQCFYKHACTRNLVCTHVWFLCTRMVHTCISFSRISVPEGDAGHRT